MFNWFNAQSAKDFGRQLAQGLLQDFASRAQASDAKFSKQAEKSLARAAQQILDFKAKQPLNFYKKSGLANEFLWTLKDGGCPPAYADELTQWLTLRL